jgi:hypothetical protein
MELFLTYFLTSLLSGLLLVQASWKEQSLPWRIVYAILATANMLLVLAVTAFYILFHDVGR